MNLGGREEIVTFPPITLKHLLSDLALIGLPYSP